MKIQTTDDLILLGAELAKAGIASNHNPSLGVAIAWECIDKNMTPIDYDRKFHTIQGKVSMKADAMLGELIGAGGSYSIKKETTAICEIHFKYKNMEYISIYTMEDAKRNKWCYTKGNTIKDNWARQPEAMLFARCCSKGMKRIAPNLVYGLYTPEELNDLPENVLLKIEQPKAFKNLTTQNIKEVNNKNTIDYNICPIGKRKGQMWASFSKNILIEALTIPQISDLDIKYIKEIQKQIKLKGEA